MQLAELNGLPAHELRKTFSACCGAGKWTNGMLQAAPFPTEHDLFTAADTAWSACTEEDWLEAFRHHPKIGDLDGLRKRFSETRHLAGTEQSAVTTASESTLLALKEGNDAYEKRFGFIFIVCATGKTAEEMLALLEQRMKNDRTTELKTAAAEQHKITILRLKKTLA